MTDKLNEGPQEVDYSLISAIASHSLCLPSIDIVRRAGIQSWAERDIPLHDLEIRARIAEVRTAIDKIEAELNKQEADNDGSE